jgi:hypothetical protein
MAENTTTSWLRDDFITIVYNNINLSGFINSILNSHYSVTEQKLKCPKLKNLRVKRLNLPKLL